MPRPLEEGEKKKMVPFRFGNFALKTSKIKGLHDMKK
jgi:hypothetical protein